MKYMLGCIACLFSLAVSAIEITDDQGFVVDMPHPPQRVVSMMPSITESICMLGKCELLVGVDRYSNWPASLAKLPTLGGGLDPNVEAILALKPDLVLVGSAPRTSERLRSLGIPVFSLNAKNYSDIFRILDRLALILDVPQKEALNIWTKMNQAVDSAAQSLGSPVPKLRVYFEVNRAPYAAGPSSFLGETLERLGVQNIIPLEQGPFPKINPEFVVNANPDVIFVGDKNFAGMTDRPGWSEIRAIKEGRVCIFKEQQADVMVRPGPRIAEGARAIAECLRDKGYGAPVKLDQ